MGESTNVDVGTTEDGARWLLADAVRIAQKSELKFAVIGGWSPVLLNRGPIEHPGTRDVDMLFERGTEQGALAALVKTFRTEGYYLSAKHDFQLLRVINVNGNPFVFNVDILHPDERLKIPPEALFIDHLEVDAEVNRRFNKFIKARSIGTPISTFLFNGHIEKFQLTPKYGENFSAVEVPLIDEVGLLVTKSESVRSPKRKRDALDIFFAVVQARDFELLTRQASRLNKEARSAIYDLGERVADKDSKFHEALASSASEHDLSSNVNAQYDEFLKRFKQLQNELESH